jgi:hypothetical protein
MQVARMHIHISLTAQNKSLEYSVKKYYLIYMGLQCLI